MEWLHTSSRSSDKDLQHPFKSIEIWQREAVIASHAQNDFTWPILLHTDGRGCLLAGTWSWADKCEWIEESLFDLITLQKFFLGVISFERVLCRCTTDRIDQGQQSRVHEKVLVEFGDLPTFLYRWHDHLEIVEWDLVPWSIQCDVIAEIESNQSMKGNLSALDGQLVPQRAINSASIISYWYYGGITHRAVGNQLC